MTWDYDEKGKPMSFAHDHFTMSYHQSRDYGIDYRDFEKVDCLPKGVSLVAIAGVWGDYQNIRCLFMDAAGNGYMRNIGKRNNGYVIRELGVDAKELWVGEKVLVPAGTAEKVIGKA
ncbi:hypothetical protein [Roseovarius aestuarii]|uniref:Uncharacterized protein n=1 Tax=Roseovarius aestuarii TaxID=475083 RepID=A0A1X7BS44_9RHOB|nr:hypothetical protein [Roseovarius aestuarii]SMC12427.1 hypothetical protein ROA7745_02252 [Roseovarius aestuarii]